MSVSSPRPGAQMIGADRARFTIWAPGCSAVSLRLGGADHPMREGDDGHFSLEIGCRDHAAYRFVTDAGQAVPDPASRLQAGDVHDESVVTGPDTFAWRHPEWRGRPWHETVLYELHPGACGGYAGIEAMLPRLAELGITAVELMPIADFPGRHNWGYDGVLPYAPDAAYGGPDALKHLIDTAHGLNLMVFLDVVYNHFGPDGNYIGSYAPQFFRDDVHTPWGIAIDYRQAPVRRYFIENAIYWLEEFRFDGLRFDAVHAIQDDEFLAAMADDIRAAIAPGRHVHLVLENDDNNAALLTPGDDGPSYDAHRANARYDAHRANARYDAQWADDTHHCLHILLTGEQSGYYEDYPDPAQQLARCLSSGFAYQGEASPHRDGARRGTPSGNLPPTAFVAFLQNHDQIGNRAMGERLTTLADPDALRAATLLLLLSPQIPLLFMGEEYGDTTPFLYFTDHGSPELAEAVRKGRRAEFSKFEAFSSKAAQQRIPDPNDPATFEASRPDFAAGERAGACDFHRGLLALRRERIMPQIPGARTAGAEALGRTGVRAVWRLGDGSTLTIAVNFGADPLVCAPGVGAIIAASPEGAVCAPDLPPRAGIAWLAGP